MPIERGDSWFSPKCIEVQPREKTILEVEHWMGSGPSAGYQPQPNCECKDNVARLKHHTEAVDRVFPCTYVRPQGRARTRTRGDGRGAFSGPRSSTVRTGGAQRRANAGMSSVMSVGIRHTASLRVPGQR